MKISMMCFALAAAGAPMMAGSASAQGLVTEPRLSSTLVVEALGAAVEACAKQGYKVTAVIVDTDGVRQGVLRGDGASIHTMDSSFLKAYTSVTYREDTIDLSERLKDGQMAPLQTKLPNVAIAAGGVALKVNGATIGVIGVGGAPGGDKDTVCARAAVDKIKDRMK